MQSIYIMTRLFMYLTLCFLRSLSFFLSFFSTAGFLTARAHRRMEGQGQAINCHPHKHVSRPFLYFHFFLTRIARARRIIAVCIHICICNVCRLYGWVGWYLSGWAGGQHHAGASPYIITKIKYRYIRGGDLPALGNISPSLSVLLSSFS